MALKSGLDPEAPSSSTGRSPTTSRDDAKGVLRKDTPTEALAHSMKVQAMSRASGKEAAQRDVAGACCRRPPGLGGGGPVLRSPD